MSATGLPVTLTSVDRAAARAMLQDVNHARREAGLPPLALDLGLCEVAKRHALDMRTRGYMGHEDPEGRSVADRTTSAGIRWRGLGENIAGGPTARASDGLTTGYPTLHHAHNGLMHSDGHRANILGDFQKIGIGVVTNADRSLIVVQVFLNP